MSARSSSTASGKGSPGELRERLLQISLRQFRKRGFDTVPVSEITREAGVAKGTFFNHFPSKNHILAEVFRRMVDRAVEEVGERRIAGSDAVVDFAFTLAGHVTRDRNLALALVPRLFMLPASVAGELSEEERIRDWIRDRLGEALPFRVPLHEIDHTALAAIVAWTLRGTLEDWVRGEARGKGLRSTLEARIGFLLESAGFPIAGSAG